MACQSLSPCSTVYSFSAKNHRLIERWSSVRQTLELSQSRPILHSRLRSRGRYLALDRGELLRLSGGSAGPRHFGESTSNSSLPCFVEKGARSSFRQRSTLSKLNHV